LTEDLREHKKDIITKIRTILTETVSGSLKSAKTSVDWDKQVEKGKTVTTEKYIIDICKAIG